MNLYYPLPPWERAVFTNKERVGFKQHLMGIVGCTAGRDQQGCQAVTKKSNRGRTRGDRWFHPKPTTYTFRVKLFSFTLWVKEMPIWLGSTGGGFGFRNLIDRL